MAGYRVNFTFVICFFVGPFSALVTRLRANTRYYCSLAGSHLLSLMCTAAPHSSASRAASGPHRCAPDSLAPSPIISNVTSSGHCITVTCSASVPVTWRRTQGEICILSPTIGCQWWWRRWLSAGCSTTQCDRWMNLIPPPSPSKTKSCYFSTGVCLVSVTTVDRRKKKTRG